MIDPDFLRELETYEFELKRNVSSIFRGERRTEYTGDGLVFSDHRRYSPGDDTRRVDWNLYARTDELYVKEFEEERNLTVHVLLDASGSMAVGEPSKFEVGAKIGLGYSYLSAAENNDFRFSVFTDEVRRLDRKQSNRGEVLRLVDELNDVEPSGRADVGSVMADYASAIDSKALVLVVSDFVPAVRSMREGSGARASVISERMDVDLGASALSDSYLVMVQPLSPVELQLPATGDTVFAAVESDAEYRTYVSPRRRRLYLERLRGHVDDVVDAAESNRGDHVLVDTSEDFFESFDSVWLD